MRTGAVGKSPEPASLDGRTCSGTVPGSSASIRPSPPLSIHVPVLPSARAAPTTGTI
jgi:hypothetical protein